MSIEIRNLSIKSSVVQRQAAEGDAAADQRPGEQPHPDEDWRAECRRLIAELLDARRER